MVLNKYLIRYNYLILWIKYLLYTSKSVLSLGLNLFNEEQLQQCLREDSEVSAGKSAVTWDSQHECSCSSQPCAVRKTGSFVVLLSFQWYATCSLLQQALIVHFWMFVYMVFSQSGMAFPSLSFTSSMKPFLIPCSSDPAPTK